jgi:uncharacterized protein (TIGR02246 family)
MGRHCANHGGAGYLRGSVGPALSNILYIANEGANMRHVLSILLLAMAGWVASAGFSSRAWSQTPASTPEARLESSSADAVKFIEAFNKQDVESLAKQFLPDGELIDETGTVYQGREEISGLLTNFFEKFPAAKIETEVESVRTVGPIAFEEGVRVITTDDRGDRNVLRYVAIRLQTPDGWQIASLRDFEEPLLPTPHERLQPLAWLVGDWVNEGDDGRIKISYQWSEDKNYLVGTYRVSRDGEELMNSQQRIGWDPALGQVRSWLFDSDGGFADGRWTQVDDAWIIKSSATLPDGTTGSATVTFEPESETRFTMKGRDRISGDERLDDFDVIVTKLPQVEKK